MGWSTSTAIRMLRVYGHISAATQQRAIEQRERYMLETALASAQIPPQFAVDQKLSIQ